MRVVIHNEPVEIMLQTISLTLDMDNPDNTYLFRCYHCGTAISRIKGEVGAINAGLIPSEDVTVISQCYQCKENYTFQTWRHLLTTFIQLTLSPQMDQTMSTFHCVICRTPLVQYNSQIALLLPEMKKLNEHTPFKCFKCDRQYFLNEIVSLSDIMEPRYITS